MNATEISRSSVKEHVTSKNEAQNRKYYEIMVKKFKERHLEDVGKDKVNIKRQKILWIIPIKVHRFHGRQLRRMRFSPD
jgi:hypothetical protein